MTTSLPCILLAAALAAPQGSAAQRPAPRPPLFSVPDGGGELVDRIAAIVGNEVITLAELERAVALHRGGPFPELSLSCGLPEPLQEDDSGEPSETGEPTAGTEDVRQRVLECLIDATLVHRHVRRFPQPGITDADIEAAYDDLLARFPSVEAFERELRRWHLTVEEVRRDLERQLQVQEYVASRFRSFVDVTDTEVEAYYHDELTPAMRARNAELPPLEQVEQQIRRVLREREVNRRMEAWLRDLRRRTEIVRYVW